MAYHLVVPKQKKKPKKPIELLREAAAGQDSQFATAQALHVGMTPDQLKGMRRRGETQQLRRGVSRFAGAPGDPDPAITAVLTCWPDYTSQARTVIDLSDPDDPWESLSILDDVIAMGAKPRWIHARAKSLANGRAGVTLLRDATGPAAAGAFNSWLERCGAHVYRVGGLPDPEWNVAVYDGRGRIGVVDAYWHQWRVVSEKEGLRFHTAPAQRRRDANRFNRLLDADYRARRFTWQDFVHEPREVLATLYRVMCAAGADLDPVRIPRHIEIPTQPFILTTPPRQGG